MTEVVPTVELNKFQQDILQYKAGTITPATFKEHSVGLGIYEERTDRTYMVRARLFAGILLPAHMKTLATVAQTFGNGTIHFTTRQDAQIHGVPLDNLHAALVALSKGGLSTNGTGGNTVRNVVACPSAGVSCTEAFDVTPYAVALTEYLLAAPNSYHLPRKFKIAFSGCGKDCASGLINDVGFIAKLRDGQPGFTVYAGGGLGARSRVADLLEEWIPGNEVHWVAEAVKRVFDKHGEREDRRKARLRYLVEKIGFAAFQELYHAELEVLKNSGPLSIALQAQRPMATILSDSATPPQEGFLDWREQYVSPQKQAGYNLVRIPLFLGDIAAAALARLADVVANHGEGAARATQFQDLTLRWVSDAELPALHAALVSAELCAPARPAPEKLAVCAGATICRLGVCQSRELATAIHDELAKRNLSRATLRDVRINISGCPNSCGRHQIADIGLYGVMRKIDGQSVPHYILQLGGHVEEGNTRLAEGTDAVPADRVPALVADLLQAYEEIQTDTFGAFLDTCGRQIARGLVEKTAVDSLKA